MITVSSPSATSLTAEFATSKYLKVISRFLAVIGAITLAGNLYALATGRFHGVRSMIEPFGASLVMLVFGALFLRGETKLIAAIDAGARTVRWSEKPTIGKGQDRSVTFDQIAQAKCWATVNYISLGLDMKDGESLALVRGEPRSDQARSAMAQLVSKLRGLGIKVECDATATGDWWKLSAA